MREFPVTVSSNVYHINSSASNLFDDDQYQRKLPAIESDINCSRFHQTATVQKQQQQQQQQCDNNKNVTNYICTSNGDLSSLQSGRLQNVSSSNINSIHNNNCNRSHKISVKNGNDKNVELFGEAGESVDGGNRTTANTASYSIFDAITNAVTTGHCVSTVYPTNERNDGDFDQINRSPDPLSSSKTIQNVKNPSHMDNECGQFQRYNYNHSKNTRTHQFPSGNYKHSYLLWIGTPVAASVAVAIVIASLAGPQWLLTEEKIRNPNFNGTINYNNAIDDGMYILKTTKSSLWILCFAQGVEYQCSKIDYFPKDEYSPDPNDSTMAIPYAVIKSTPFFLISGFILVVSYLILMVAMCSQRHSVLFFFSGIFFIIAGLIMLIGIIMYISMFKSEIGSKLRPRSMFQPPLFTYRYGHSFILFVIGCISAEIVGTLNFFLFIQIRETGREKTIPCFMYASTAKDETDEKQINPLSQEFKMPPPFKCQKHPSIPKAFFSPLSQRRYFFEKPAQKCDRSQKNLTKSLNELYTDQAPNTLFPYDLPHEFPLTRSVSTATDIFSNCSGGFASANTNSHKSLRMYTPQLNKRAMNRQQQQQQQQHQQQQQQYDMQNRSYKSISRDGSRDSLNDTGIGNKGILTNREKSKDELFMEFCQKAGQRPKPKDIYFIDTYDGPTENDVFVVENYATIHKNRRNPNVSGVQKVNNVYNSIQSLKELNSSGKKSYPMNNLYDANNFGGSSERAAGFQNATRDNYLLHRRNNSRDSNLYASRTLPRDFLKRSNDYDLDEFCNRRISANGIYTPYNISMTLPSTTDPMTISAPKEFTDHATDFYKKSYDTLASRNSRQRDAYTGSEDQLSVQWPNAIPGSPASFSNRFNYHGALFSPSVQRKPAQMSTFYSQHFPCHVKQQTPVNKVAYFPHESKTNGSSTRFNDNVEYENGMQTGNENSNGSSSGGSDECTTFDLDRIERERRKSHASLFEIDVDFTNGTPV